MPVPTCCEATATIHDLYTGTNVNTVVVGERIGAASAAKSAFALYNKGRLALAELARSLAKHHDVLPVLEAQSDRDSAMLAEADRIARLPEVAWRWGPEFDEIAATLDDAGLEGEALRGLRAVWTRLT